MSTQVKYDRFTVQIFKHVRGSVKRKKTTASHSKITIVLPIILHVTRQLQRLIRYGMHGMICCMTET